MYSFLKVKLSKKNRVTRTKYDIRNKNLPTVLANNCNRSLAGHGAQYRKQVSNLFTVNFIFCPSKANLWRFKRCQTIKDDMQITAEYMQTYSE